MKKFSKNTLKLLKFFYAHHEGQFYIQELGRLLKKKPGVFQRALYNLEDEGVLKSDYRANARFFSLNKNYTFYKEFKSIVRKITKLVIILSVFNLFHFGFNAGFCAEKKSNGLILSSLKDMISLALKNNKDVQIQEYGLKVSEANILGARSEFLPKLDFDAGYTHNGAVLYNSAGTNPKKDIRIFSGYTDDNMMGVSVSDIIYNGGANLANLRQAQVALKEQSETLRATKLNVELEAKRLYYGLLLAYEAKRIAQGLVEQAKSHYEQVEQNFKQGTSSRFDVLQSKVQVSLLEPQLINAQNSIDLIIAEIDKLLSIKVGNEVIINDKLMYEPTDIREADFLKEAYLNQPEMILKSLGIDMSKWQIKYARAGWLPQIDANAEYVFRSNNYANMFNNRHSNWNIGFSLRIPVFDGFSTKAKVDAAKAQLLQAATDKENLADQVAVDIRKGCLDLIQASSVIKSQTDNLADAKEALEISYVRYNNGVGINLDVLDSQVSLANVEKNIAEGIYDYIMAKAQLERSMGKSIIETEDRK